MAPLTAMTLAPEVVNDRNKMQAALRFASSGSGKGSGS